MTHNLDPNNESPFGLIYPEDSPFGPPIRLGPHEVSSAEVPPYEKRVEILLGEAHALLLGFEGWHLLNSPPEEILDQMKRRTQRWLDRYELHLCQIDHPDLRHERPLGVPPTIDGEVTG